MARTSPSTRALIAVTVALTLVAGVPACTLRDDADPGPGDGDDPIARGCALDRDLLTRIWRGHHPAHSEDITTVPRKPNFPGAFSVLGHSGPWDYLQRVPLVLYGPGRIASSASVGRPVTLADVYPTMGRIANTSLARGGRALTEALVPSADAPRVVVTIVWDGAGSNVLERWPNAHPTLDRLVREGTAYADASVGSSPSITPAVHSTLGTGLFPRDHGVTAIEYRGDDGRVHSAFARVDPRQLEVTTFADEIDRAFANRSEVGMVAWKSWHLGMFGHGTAAPGGDPDDLALLHNDDRAPGNDRFYATPQYLSDGIPGLDALLDRQDRRDGRADGKWKGSDVREHDNPAWVDFQTDAAVMLMANEGFGDDDVPDFLFLNYKMTDIVGHYFSMDSPRMEAVLAAQDRALARLVAWLEREVGDYVVLVTADHGHTPAPERTGGWPILVGELSRDVERRFPVPGSERLVQETSPVGLFLDRETMATAGVGERDIARFLNSYTLRENWNDATLPSRYRDRAGERILSAAFGKHDLPRIMECARRAAAERE